MTTHKACIYAGNVFHLNIFFFSGYRYILDAYKAYICAGNMYTNCIPCETEAVHIKHTFCWECVHANNIRVLWSEYYEFHRKYQYKA